MFLKKKNKIKKQRILCRVLFIFLINIAFCVQVGAQKLSGFIPTIVTEISKNGSDFPLITPSSSNLSIRYDEMDHAGVIRAIHDLQTDFESVTGKIPILITSDISSEYEIIIGTLGKSKWIDKLISSNKLDAFDLHDKWESFVITTLQESKSVSRKTLVIAGSDMRGTIYGIYELSRQMGVSPWYWWADVPIQKRSSAYVLAGRYSSGEPKVKYRGIFINDEVPCMTNWAKEKFGGMNSKMYAHMFELLLRLRGNCLWPGMWGSFKEYKPLVPILKDKNGNYEGNCFNEDDPENPRMADEYGIIIGTSHHEPMQRSQQEWIRNKQNYGNGQWNYLTNKEGIQQFFREGIENTKNYESLITLGMRGEEDTPMVDAGSVEANFRTLEGIIHDQRNIIKEVTGKPITETPQIWTLYSEVLEYYDLGLNVPDDVIILLSDDNWGDVRRLPELNSKKHPGGYGMYYHLCYYGAPRSAKWINNTPIQHIWEQLQLTYSYNVDKVWILNVGDLKPHEYPMDFFMNMAWDPTLFNENNLVDYTVGFCEDKFGKNQAKEAAEILNTYNQYNSRVTAEMLNDTTFNLESGEFLQVKDAYMALESRALRQFIDLPEEYKDAYFELVLFPVQAMANIYDMYYSLAMNKKLANNKELEANSWADRVEYCFYRDSVLCGNYNTKVANGKWDHMMDQVHIGYTKWHPPQYNVMPQVIRVKPEESIKGGYLFKEKNRVVVMDAEHYFENRSSKETNWAIIPNLGRTRSGIALMPYTESTNGASLSYKFQMDAKTDSIKVRFYFDSTLPFIKGGHNVSASFQGGQKKTWNINNDLVWKNKYTKMYPTGAARLIESEIVLDLPKTKNKTYILNIYPENPGIVLYKIIVDNGGYEQTWLKMNESPYNKN